MNEPILPFALSCEDPAGMSEESIRQEMAAILAFFDEASQEDPYGWDWPTMYARFPSHFARGRALSEELQRRAP